MWEEFVLENEQVASGHGIIKGKKKIEREQLFNKEIELLRELEKIQLALHGNNFGISFALRAALRVEIQEWLRRRDRTLVTMVEDTLLQRGVDVFEKAINEFIELRNAKAKDDHKNFPRDIISEYTMG